MKFVLFCLVVAAVATGSNAFFGANYNISQSSSIISNANSIITSQSKAQKAVKSIAIPTNAVYLQDGFVALSQLVNNMTNLATPLLNKLVTNVNDVKTKIPSSLLTNWDIASLNTFLSGPASTLISTIYTNFGSSNTTLLLSTYVSNVSTAVSMAEMYVQSVVKSLDAAVTAKPVLTMSQFLATLQPGTLDNLVANLNYIAGNSTSYANVVTNLVTAVKSADIFYSKLNANFLAYPALINKSVDSYVNKSAALTTSLTTALSNLLNFTTTTNATFMASYKMQLSPNGLNFMINLNSSLYQLLQTYNQTMQYSQMYGAGYMMSNSMQAQSLIQQVNATAYSTQQMLLNVVNPNPCVSNYASIIVNGPITVANYFANKIVPDQLTTEKLSAAVAATVINSNMQNDIKVIYNELATCINNNQMPNTQACMDNMIMSMYMQTSKPQMRLSAILQVYQMDLQSSLFNNMNNFASSYSWFNGLQSVCFPYPSY